MHPTVESLRLRLTIITGHLYGDMQVKTSLIAGTSLQRQSAAKTNIKQKKKECIKHSFSMVDLLLS